MELELVIITSRLSDNFPVIHLKKLTRPKNKTEFIETRDFSQTNLDRFNTNLRNVNWEHIFNEQDAQTAYNTFSDMFFGLYDIQFPLICKKFNRNHHALEKWMSSGILISRSEKIRLSNLSLSDPYHLIFSDLKLIEIFIMRLFVKQRNCILKSNFLNTNLILKTCGVPLRLLLIKTLRSSLK